jgi:Bacterial DNA polymerase III alpha NTPase domain
MKTNSYGEIVLEEQDLCDLVMQGKTLQDLSRVTVDPAVDLESLVQVLEDPSVLVTWTFPSESNQSVSDWDAVQQRHWYMPKQYQELDIAEHVLGLCATDAELQRCGHELMLYQERGLFDLLRYLKYLVDVMTENRVIWGVGRGSSVASYVLYLLGVHRINSMFYDLDVGEFLR